MTAKTWKLMDTEDGTYLENLHIGPADVGRSDVAFSVQKRTLRGGLNDGVDVIEVDNGGFRFTVLPTRGMALWKGWLGQNLLLGWKSPIAGPVHPKFVPLGEPSGLAFLDGFDEWLARCGLESNGAPEFDTSGRLIYALHGRIANRPAHQVEVDVDDSGITVRGVVDETRFHFHKLRMTVEIRTRFGEPGLTLTDQVQNRSDNEGQFQLLYHWNLGPPILEAGSELVAPVEILVPRNDWAARGVGHWSSYTAPTVGMTERVYYFRLFADDDGNTQVLLKNASATLGMSLAYNVKQLPCFTQWKNETGLGDGYVTGLEPATNYPNPRSFEGGQGRVIRLAPGQVYPMRLQIAVHDTADSVASAERAIEQIRGNRAPLIHASPQPGWCEGVEG